MHLKNLATWLVVIGRKVCWTSQLGGSGGLSDVDGQDDTTGGGWFKMGTGGGWRFGGADTGVQPPWCSRCSPPTGSGLLQVLPMSPRSFPNPKSKLFSFWSPPGVIAMSEHALVENTFSDGKERQGQNWGRKKDDNNEDKKVKPKKKKKVGNGKTKEEE